MPDTFDRAMGLMCRRDPQRQEDGFSLMRSVAPDVVPRLVASYRDETDRGMKCWLLELIGGTGSPEAVPLLSDEMLSDDEALRSWACRGLLKVDNVEARSALRSAGPLSG